MLVSVQDVMEILSLLGTEGGEPLCQPLKGGVHVLAAFPLCPRDQVPEGVRVHFSHSCIPPIVMPPLP